LGMSARQMIEHQFNWNRIGREFLDLVARAPAAESTDVIL